MNNLSQSCRERRKVPSLSQVVDVDDDDDDDKNDNDNDNTQASGHMK